MKPTASHAVDIWRAMTIGAALGLLTLTATGYLNPWALAWTAFCLGGWLVSAWRAGLIVSGRVYRRARQERERMLQCPAAGHGRCPRCGGYHPRTREIPLPPGDPPQAGTGAVTPRG